MAESPALSARSAPGIGSAMTKSAAEIIDQIGDLIKGVWKDSESAEALSKNLNDIAVLNWALAQWQTVYEEQERLAKTELDIAKAKMVLEFTEDGEAVNKAETKAQIYLGEQRREYNRVASSLERIKITARANQAAMDAVRSRLSLIKGSSQ